MDRVHAIELGAHSGDEAFQFIGTFLRQILLLERIVLQVEELEAAALVLEETSMRRDFRQGMMDDLPVTVTPDREIVAAMSPVRVVHQELFRTRGIPFPLEQFRQIAAIDGMFVRIRIRPDETEDRGKQVGHIRDLTLHRPCGDGQFLLPGIFRIGRSPRGEEGGPHPALVVGSFLAAKGCGAGDDMLVAERCVAAIVAEEKDESVLRHLERLELVEEIAEALVHALDEGGEGDRIRLQAFVRIIRRKARISLERGMHRVVGEVEKEGLFLLYRRRDELVGLDGEGFGEEGVAAMIGFETGHGAFGPGPHRAVVLLAEVAARCPDRASREVDLETDLRGIRAVVPFGTKMSLPRVDRAIAPLAQDTRESEVARFQADPVPILRSLRAGVVLPGIDPVRGAMASSVLSGLDRDPGRRADAHRIELVETDPLRREPLHRGRAVEVIQRIPLGFAFGVGEKWHRGIHHPHVIDQENDDIGKISGAHQRQSRKDHHRSEESSHLDHGATGS